MRKNFTPFRRTALAVALFTLAGAVAAETIQVDWERRYNGSALLSNDTGTVVRTDASGHVYVAGSTQTVASTDFVLIKYAPDGHRLWKARYDSQGGTDRVSGMVVNEAGEIYVTGQSGDANLDIVTIKYAADGTRQWVRRYDYQAGQEDSPVAIALDPDGNVVVAGQFYDVPGETAGYTILKYSPSGARLWNLYHAPGGWDWLSDMAVDAAGNIYLTGSSGSLANGQFRFLTVKVTPEGTPAWSRLRGNPQGWTGDQASRIALDGQGNVYVAGCTSDANGDCDFATEKYTTAGVFQWRRLYPQPAGAGWRSPSDLTVDSQGHALWVGSAVKAAGEQPDMLIAKYAPDGTRAWVRRVSAPGGAHPNAMALDAQDAVYVTGLSSAGSDQDMRTVKYDATGMLQWTQRSGRANFHDYALSLALDPFGAVLITGESWTGGLNGMDILTVKYSPIP